MLVNPSQFQFRLFQIRFQLRINVYNANINEIGEPWRTDIITFVVLPTMSCFADWSKRRHVTFVIIECCTRHGRRFNVAKIVKDSSRGNKSHLPRSRNENAWDRPPFRERGNFFGGRREHCLWCSLCLNFLTLVYILVVEPKRSNSALNQLLENKFKIYDYFTK